MLDLQDRIGEKIAKLLGVEAALVTTGAAGGILVGTAAAVTYRDQFSAVVRRNGMEGLLEVLRARSGKASATASAG